MMCGVHFRSDLEAGRRAAQLLLSEMNRDPGFRATNLTPRPPSCEPPLLEAQGSGHSSASRAPPRLALDPAVDTAPVQRGNSRHDCESESEAAGFAIAAGVEPRERVEHRGPMGFGNSLPVVFDDQATEPVLARDFDADGAPRVTQRIRQQIAQRQLHEPRLHPQRLDIIVPHVEDLRSWGGQSASTCLSHGAMATDWQSMRRPG